MTHHMENDGDDRLKKKKRNHAMKVYPKTTLPPAGESNKTLT